MTICSCMDKPKATRHSEDTEQPKCSTTLGRQLHRVVYGPNSPYDGLQELAAEWNQLLSRSRFDTLFLTHEWQTIWWEKLGEGELWVLGFRDPAKGDLVGIAPLYRVYNESGRWAGQYSFHIVGCTEVSDYLDVIIAEGWEKAVYADLLDWLNGPMAPEWQAVDLCNLPEVSRTYQDLPGLAEANGIHAEVTQEDVAPYIPLPCRYNDYLANQVDKKQRHEIRRKQRRALRETQVSFHFVNEQDDLDTAMEHFVALQRMSRADKEEFMTPQMQEFFKALARCMMDAGYLRLSFLEMDGVKAATYLAFEYNGSFMLYNSGYHTGDYSHLSPGWVLLAYLIQYAIAVGCSVFDFLQGNEEYKYRFGSQDHKVMRVILQRP